MKCYISRLKRKTGYLEVKNLLTRLVRVTDKYTTSCTNYDQAEKLFLMPEDTQNIGICFISVTR